jgi:hypothetical protein
MNENFFVSIKLMKNKIFAQLDYYCEDRDYAFELYRFSNPNNSIALVDTTKYGKKTDCTFEINESGYYFVRGYVRKDDFKVNKDSYTVLYLNEEFSEKFNHLVKSDLKTQNTINDPIPYFKVPDPQNDFCFIYNFNKETVNKNKFFNDWCNQNEYEISFIKWGWGMDCFLISDCSKNQFGYKDNRVFSGYVWVNEDNAFYMGQESMKSNFETVKFYDCYGMFTLFNKEANKIVITSDYFGFCRIFYYLFEDKFVVANNYHFLLNVLNKIGVKTMLDKDMVYSVFASNVTLFRQTYTSELSIKNTYMLPINKRIEIDKTGSINFTDKKIQSIFNEPYEKYDEGTYTALINKAKEEIINNIDMLRKCGLFENIIVDLSGGKDSRTNFAALTNLKNSKQDFSLFTSINTENDVEIAVGINNIFKYQYDKTGDVFYQHSPLEYLKNNRSYFCGYCYLWRIESSHLSQGII